MANPKRKNPKSTAISYYESSGDTYPDVSSANPLPITIVSGGSGGGTEYTEDAAAAANPVGTAVNLIRQDTPSALVTTDGNNVAQRGTNYGAAYTQIVSSTGAFIDTFGGGTQYTKGDTDASPTGTVAMMEVAANTLQPVQGTVADGLLVNLGTNNDVTATGAAANGAAVSGNPVLIGGEDPSGNVARLQTAPDGDLVVHQHSAATALADAASNTMHIPVNMTDSGFLATPSANYLFNGTTWDRVRGDATNGMLVNLGANNDVTVSSSALPSGAATSAKQDTIIGHVDGIEGLLTTIDADTGALAAIDYATGADVASLAVVGGGAEATALRVTLANDSTGVIGVTDNGGSITVDNDGTFPVQAEVVTTALTASAPGTASVGVTSASAVATNSSRKGLTLVNLSNSFIYLGFSGETAVVGSGLALAPNGGSFEMTAMTFTAGAINAIADLASSTLAIQEWE